MNALNNNNFDDVTQGIVEDVMLQRGCTHPSVNIFATCVLEVERQFFLIIAFEVNIGGNDNMEHVIVVRISREQASALLRAGVRPCRVVDSLPSSVLGSSIEPQCAFKADDLIVIVLFIRTSGSRTPRLAFLITPKCPVVDL